MVLTVKDVIEKLQTLPPTYQLRIEDITFDNCDIKDFEVNNKYKEVIIILDN